MHHKLEELGETSHVRKRQKRFQRFEKECIRVVDAMTETLNNERNRHKPSDLSKMETEELISLYQLESYELERELHKYAHGRSAEEIIDVMNTLMMLYNKMIMVQEDAKKKSARDFPVRTFTPQY